MNEQNGIRLRLLLGWSLGLVLAVAAVGGALVWSRWGPHAVLGMAVGASAAIVAFSAALAAMRPRRAGDRQKLALRFLAVSPLRVVGTMGLSALGWAMLDLRPAPVFVSAALYYLVLLAAEVIWLASILKRTD